MHGVDRLLACIREVSPLLYIMLQVVSEPSLEFEFRFAVRSLLLFLARNFLHGCERFVFPPRRLPSVHPINSLLPADSVVLEVDIPLYTVGRTRHRDCELCRVRPHRTLSCNSTNSTHASCSASCTTSTVLCNAGVPAAPLCRPTSWWIAVRLEYPKTTVALGVQQCESWQLNILSRKNDARRDCTANLVTHRSSACLQPLSLKG